MGSEALRGRDVWQDYSGANAANAERDFFMVFTTYFKGTDYRVRSKPKEFKNIYVNVDLEPRVLSEIYTPEKPVTRHGVSPDYCIDNTNTQKTLYVEVKRQDGWVEGGKRSDGRGNAHERSCKFFTPGLLSVLREHSKIEEPALPFWVVFQGDITRDPCRVREISLWYQGVDQHHFFWRDSTNENPLIEHFNTHLKHLLD